MLRNFSIVVWIRLNDNKYKSIVIIAGAAYIWFHQSGYIVSRNSAQFLYHLSLETTKQSDNNDNESEKLMKWLLLVLGLFSKVEPLYEKTVKFRAQYIRVYLKIQTSSLSKQRIIKSQFWRGHRDHWSNHVPEPLI